MLWASMLVPKMTVNHILDCSCCEMQHHPKMKKMSRKKTKILKEIFLRDTCRKTRSTWRKMNIKEKFRCLIFR